MFLLGLKEHQVGNGGHEVVSVVAASEADVHLLSAGDLGLN